MSKVINLENKTVLVTGVAGFIGYWVTKRLLETVNNIKIIGLDIMSPYYDITLKEKRLEIIKGLNKNFEFIKQDITDKDQMFALFEKYKFNLVVHLAAEEGIPHSLENPDEFVNSNVVGCYNIIEACRFHPVEHLIYSSSSCIYGNSKKVPNSTEDKADEPTSLYAATKKGGEILSYSYSKLYNIPVTCLRLFTTYGPMGRPDMAYFSFTDKLVKGETIEIFNNGDIYRDYIYIDDVVHGIIITMQKTPEPDENSAQHRIYNLGNGGSINLIYFVDLLEQCLLAEGLIKEKGKRKLLPMQPGDTYQTYADMEDYVKDFGFRPSTELEDGLLEFIKWYKEYYLSAK